MSVYGMLMTSCMLSFTESDPNKVLTVICFNMDELSLLRQAEHILGLSFTSNHHTGFVNIIIIELSTLFYSVEWLETITITWYYS